MKDFRRLSVWDRAHHLTLETYKVTSKFSRDELYGITSQMRRSSASIAANIAEGCGRTGNGEFHRFLNTAAGSANERGRGDASLVQRFKIGREARHDDIARAAPVLFRPCFGLGTRIVHENLRPYCQTIIV